MAASKFIPQVWSARILERLQNSLVYGDLFNRDYEGEITGPGDTVHIGMISDVAIKTYSKTADIAAPDDVSAEDETLVIDQGDYFNIAISDVDKVQSALNLLDEATARAGYGFSNKTDAYLGKLLADNAKAAEFGTKTAPTAVSKDNAYDLLADMRVALNKANCPLEGRVVVVPAEFEGAMIKDSRFVAVGTDASNDRLENGTVYKAAGFTVKVSNNTPSGEYGTSDSKKAYFDIVASSPVQGTFADQILKTEAYRPENRFSDAVKGLHVYGAKVLRPDIVAVAHVSF